MDQDGSAVARFFAQYEGNLSEGTATAVTEQFAETFLAGGPQGAQCVRTADFALALPKRKEMFARAGHRATELAGLTETPLDGRYTLAQTKWRMRFERAGGDEETIEVETTFVMDGDGAGPRILVYLAHQDIFQIMKERGLSR